MNDIKKAFYKFIPCLVLLLVAYAPTLAWMYHRWTAHESYYSHGPLIPLVSLFIMWQRRDILRRIAIKEEKRGIMLVAAGLILHIICAGLRVYFVSGFLFVLVLYGLILLFFGKDWTRNLIFPILFLLAMVPLPLVVIGNLTVKLKLFAAQCATILLNRMGFPSIRDGSIIRMPNSFIMVEAPCSGLRSLISLLTLGILFAHSMKVSNIKRGILFLSSAPIALLSNISRIVMLAAVNDLYGEKVAMGFFHDFSGFLVFAFAFAGLFGVSRLLEPKRTEFR